MFVSISQVIGCEDRLRNDLYCVGWGVKLYSNQTKAGSLVTSSRPPGRLQKRPDDRTWNAGVALRTADGSRRTADAGDEPSTIPEVHNVLHCGRTVGGGPHHGHITQTTCTGTEDLVKLKNVTLEICASGETDLQTVSSQYCSPLLGSK